MTRRSATLTVCPGAPGRGQRHLRHRPVVRIAIVRRDEAQARREVGGLPSAAIRRRLVTSIHPQSACGRLSMLVVAGQPALPHPCRGGVAPGVVVEVEAEVRCGRRRDVAPGEQLVAVQRPARGIEAGGDGVAGVSRRARLRRGDGRGGRRCLGFGVQSGAADRHDCTEGNGAATDRIAPIARARARCYTKALARLRVRPARGSASIDDKLDSAALTRGRPHRRPRC